MLKATMTGHLGNDATIKDVSGKKVTEFSLAHTEKYKVNGVSHERTTWVRCALWDREAVTPYLKKGTLVMVYGTPSVQAYAAKADGKPAAALNLRVDNIELLGGKKEPTAGGTGSSGPATNTNEDHKPVVMPADIDDDLPF